MTEQLLKLMLRVLITAGVLDAGKSYSRKDIVSAAENYCKDYPG
jgi:hypothetical protein